MCGFVLKLKFMKASEPIGSGVFADRLYFSANTSVFGNDHRNVAQKNHSEDNRSNFG
jgi:hypothetical protein